MKKIFIPLIILIGIGLSAMAQESNKKTQGDKVSANSSVDNAVKSTKELKGDKFAWNYSYDKAIDSYTSSKELTLSGQRSLAVSYHKMGKNIQAEEAYAKLVNTPGGTLPEDYYNYAMVLQMNGKFDQADTWMKKYIEQKPNDLRAKNYTANNGKLVSLLNDDGKFKVSHMDVNTDALDFGTSFYKDEVVFSSSRPNHGMIRRTSNWTGQPYYDMYVAKVELGQLKDPKEFARKLNGKWNDGPASFTKDGSFMAFTRDNYSDPTIDRKVQLEIYFSNAIGGNKWSKPVPFVLNNKNYSVGQPCLTANGKTMYFSSDMPGGYGGADLYKVTKDASGNWGAPQNLGDKINTEGDEMFPFFEENNEVLFFSSNGRFGLGGLDLYICPTNGEEYGKVYNAGFPLNSQADDFGAIVNSTLTNGYFTSNRLGGSGGDDIYSFDVLKDLDIGKKIKGIAMDKYGSPIPNTFVKLLDEQGNLIDTVTTKDDAAYAFLVESDKNFKLYGDKPKYIEGDTVANTFGKKFIVTANLVLLQKEEIVVKKIETVPEVAVVNEPLTLASMTMPE